MNFFTFKFLFLFIVFYVESFNSQPYNNWDDEKIVVINESQNCEIMNMESVYDDGWDQLPQIMFWKRIMHLSPDSCLVNCASNRKVLKMIPFQDWNSLTKIEKTEKREFYKKEFNLPSDEYVYVTSGKRKFYLFKKVYPSLAPGVAAFEKNNVDPWYAQAILLIESPAQLKKSVVGAYGAFQLMPAVARAQGLKVNSKIDERKDFDKSAFAASQLIKKICIPHAKKILNAHNIEFKEDDLWFRLFVLHIYHAGAYNVKAVVDKIAPKSGGQDLIREMWMTKAASFGNNSQNYSQVALASQLILYDIVHEEFEAVYNCH
tara:strand:- start:701 stop:1654 length:954 start_codon:yes stop_codon:yes gene_type:complete